MIDSIRLKNFKCFKDETVPLKPLTVLSGVNGMGKSTLIQALLFLRQWAVEPHRDSSRGLTANLNGSLVNFGHTDDVLYENAGEGENIVLSVAENGRKGEEYVFGCPKGVKWLNNSSNVKKKINTASSLYGGEFCYLGAERVGPRTSFSSFSSGVGDINAIGNNGEYCAWMLKTFERKGVEDDQRIHPEGKVRELGAQVDAWLSEIGQTTRTHLNEHRDMDKVSLQFSFVRDRQPSDRYRPTNVGFGLTYALPVFVAALFLRKGGLLIIENPEAHLHPKGQSVMGKFLARVAASGVQVIVETHSDHLLNGIRIDAKQGKIDPESVALHFFQRSEDGQSTTIVTPKMDKDGRLNKWPEGFFDEWENGLAQLL